MSELTFSAEKLSHQYGAKEVTAELEGKAILKITANYDNLRKLFSACSWAVRAELVNSFLGDSQENIAELCEALDSDSKDNMARVLEFGGHRLEVLNG